FDHGPSRQGPRLYDSASGSAFGDRRAARAPDGRVHSQRNPGRSPAMIHSRWSSASAAAAALLLAASALAAGDGSMTVHKRSRSDQGGAWVVRESVEEWQMKQSAVIVCDVWDAHHCLNAV